MKKSLSPDEVLALPAGSELARLLRASEHGLAEILRCFVGQPGVQLDETDRSFSFSSIHVPPGSMVLKTSWSPTTAEAWLGLEIERFLALRQPFEWHLFGSPHARDLARRLTNRGFSVSSARWMIADLAALPDAPKRPHDLRVSEVESSSQMVDWSAAFARGFGTTSLVTATYQAAYLAAPCSSARVERRVHRVAYAGDVPVACSTLLLAGGIATLWDVATAPEFRGRGYAGCLVRADLEEAIRVGYRRATLYSSNAGRSLYRKLGFDVELSIPEFDWQPP
jgi:ribosomal protein S18 acetylase RimI-like enzyme